MVERASGRSIKEAKETKADKIYDYGPHRDKTGQEKLKIILGATQQKTTTG